MNVAIDRKSCAGHGLCYVYAPGVFTDDDQGYAQVVNDGSVASAHETATRTAITNCPERAIVDQS